jgi:hypothetical protein
LNITDLSQREGRQIPKQPRTCEHSLQAKNPDNGPEFANVQSWMLESSNPEGSPREGDSIPVENEMGLKILSTISNNHCDATASNFQT